MIFVEKSVELINDEISRLETADGPNSELYARGALDALYWVLCGTTAPSFGGEKHFPVVLQADGRVQ